MLERNIKLVNGIPLFTLWARSKNRSNLTITDCIGVAPRYISFLFFLCTISFSNIALSDQTSRSSQISQTQVARSHAALSQAMVANEIVFIDSAVTDQSILLDAMQRNAEVVVLPAEEDGFAYIAKTLQNRSSTNANKLDAIHVVSHGGSGQLSLGSVKLDVNTLQNYSNEIAVIRNALDGDILLYGCDVAKGSRGQEFISAFSESTSAAVLASNDLTGGAAQGGDWVLETQQGNVQTDVIFAGQQIERYTNVLADPAITSTAITSATENSAYSYTISASDADIGDVLTYSAPVKPTWLNFDASSQVLSGTPANADVGSHSVTLRVSDGTADVDQSFTITVADVNNSPTGAPTISGTAKEGQQLLAVTSSIDDADGLGTGGFTYLWKRSGNPISGATGDAYTLVQADVNTRISVTVSFVDGGGKSESITSSDTSLVANTNNEPAGLPVISGTAKQGVTLTADVQGITDADGLGTSGFSYQWRRDGSSISGATGSAYALAQADVGALISVTVSYIDGGSTTESLTSINTSVVANTNDAPTGLPTITGAVKQGETLTAGTQGIADADGLGTGGFSFQWKRSGAQINGATGNTYTLVQTDVNSKISVTVSYIDGGGAAESLTSTETVAVVNQNIPATGNPVINSDSLSQGGLLTADTSGITDADGLGTSGFNYQWKRSGSPISGATGSTYTLVQADVNSKIRVTVSFIDGGGTTETLSSAETALVTNTNDEPTGELVISGDARQKVTLNSDTSAISDLDGLGAFSYQWLRSGGVISGATGSSYTLVQDDVGELISLRVTYTDGGNTIETVVSQATTSVIDVNDAPVGTLIISGTAAQNQALVADATNISDKDGPAELVFSYQWLRGGQAIAGATTNTYVLTQQDVGALISVRVAYTDSGNTAETVESAKTTAVANENDAPTGALTISGSVVQNQVLTANASAISDIDGLGTFSYQWLRGGEIIVGATVSTYTLVQQDVDGFISVKVSYTDGGGTLEQVFSGTLGPVGNVNDIGVVTITGSATDGSLITIADITDIDGTDGSNFSYQWLKNGERFGQTGDSYTVVVDDIGSFISVTVSYTDDQGTPETITSNKVGAIRPDVPKVTAPPEIAPVNATGWFTYVVLDPDSVATAFDTLDNSVITPVSDSNGQFRPGETIVTWSATDEAGNVGTATQIVKVKPMAEVSKIQRVAEGGNYAFKIVLNGDALQYPVTVPYTVSDSNLGTGSADSSDHNLVSSSVSVIEPATPDALPEAVINFSVTDDGIEEGLETIVITLGAPENAVLGPYVEHTIEIAEANVAPSVNLEASQLQVGRNSDPVMTFALAEDVNGIEGEVLTFNWSGTDDAITNANGDIFSIDPSGLKPGFYTLQVTVDDNTATENATATDTLILNVIEELPVLSSSSDVDGDGIDDAAEGFMDSDSDGIADYMDALSAGNVIQILPAISDEFIMQTEPGLKLKLAEISFKANIGSVLVEEQDVVNFASGSSVEPDTIENIGGYFDFTISGLPVPGQIVNVVIPQLSELPRVPVYRKLTASGWQDFVEDSNNSVSSAAGKKGYCPPPGDSAYKQGLKQGHWCLQLTIKDGGPNDSDGEENRRITDPGGLGRVLSSVTVSSGGGGGGSLNPFVVFLSVFILLAVRRQRVIKNVT